MFENLEHCAPDVLIDLAEGAPVDARARQHVGACDACAERVRELRRTLDVLGEVESPEPAASYWPDFRARLAARIESEPHRRPQPRIWWAVTAAAVVCGFFIARGLVTEMTPGIEDESVAALLPPVDEDPEFQFLVSVADFVEPGEDWDTVSSGIATTFEYGLTGEEETLLVEKLKNDIEEKAHGKS